MGGPSPRRWQFPLRALVLGTLLFAMALTSLDRFPAMILRPRAAAAAVLLLTVGGVVGSIFGSQPVAGIAVACVSFSFFVGIVSDSISTLGDELTLWSFQSLCLGLFVGSLRRMTATDSQSEVPDDSAGPP